MEQPYDLLGAAREIQHLAPMATADPKHREALRSISLQALEKLFRAHPPAETVVFELILLLLLLPVYERIYVQRTLRPLAQAMECSGYLTDLSRALQETDAWVDLNILTDKERRSLPDMGLEIIPEFKLP